MKAQDITIFSFRVNIFLRNMVALGQEKIEGFASATEFDDELIDGLRFILERMSGLLSQEKMQFLQQAADINRQVFQGGRQDALRLCRRAFRIICRTNAAVIIKKGGSF